MSAISVLVRSRGGDVTVAIPRHLIPEKTRGRIDGEDGYTVGLCVNYSLRGGRCTRGVNCTYAHIDNAVNVINGIAGRTIVYADSGAADQLSAPPAQPLANFSGGGFDRQQQQQQQQDQWQQPPTQQSSFGGTTFSSGYSQQQEQQWQAPVSHQPHHQQQPSSWNQPSTLMNTTVPAAVAASASAMLDTSSAAAAAAAIQNHEDSPILVKIHKRVAALKRRDFAFTTGLATASETGQPVGICRGFLFARTCPNGNSCRNLHADDESKLLSAVEDAKSNPVAAVPAKQSAPLPIVQQQQPQKEEPAVPLPPSVQEQEHHHHHHDNNSNSNSNNQQRDEILPFGGGGGGNRGGRGGGRGGRGGGQQHQQQQQQQQPAVNWDSGKFNQAQSQNRQQPQQYQYQVPQVQQPPPQRQQEAPQQQQRHQQQQQQLGRYMYNREEQEERARRRAHYYQIRIAQRPGRPAERVISTYGQRPTAQKLQYIRRLGFCHLPPELTVNLPRTKEEAAERDFHFAAEAPCRHSIAATGHPIIDSREEQSMMMDLHPSSYALNSAPNVKERLHQLLYAEEAKCIVDLLTFAKTAVQVVPYAPDPRLYEVPAEGVSEKRPSVLRGDTIHCALSPSSEAPCWDAGSVWYVHLDKLIVSFDANSSIARAARNNAAVVDVVFVDQDRTQWRQMHRAVDDGLFLSPDVAAMLRAPQMMPENGIDDAERQAQSLRAFHPLSLNENQLRFVETVCTAAARGAPGTGMQIVVGPPGTGKTTSVISCIAGLCHLFKNARVLVTCPSNAAADLIVERLDSGYEMFRNGKRRMLRIHALSRSERDVPPSVLHHSKQNGAGGFEFPTSEQELRQYHVVVSTLSTTGKLYGIGVPTTFFSHVVVDEAGQATEQQLMLATTFLGRGTAGLLLAGDHKQLGPVIHSGACKEGGMGVSGYERLCYSLPPEKVTLLTVNYRSHPSILHGCVNVVYEDRLHAARTNPPVPPTYMGLRQIGAGGASPINLPAPWRHPLLFVHVEGREERTNESPSWRNMDEVQVVLATVKDLVKAGESPDDIAILTPYLLQRETIEKALYAMMFRTREIKISAELELERKYTMAPTAAQQQRAAQANQQQAARPRRRCPIEVCTVEAFQGKEKKIVIVSCVRSRMETVGTDIRNHLGFMAQPQRSNVALSRAQDLLIIVANACLFLTDGMRDVPSADEAAAVGTGAKPLPIAMNLAHNSSGLWHTVITRIRDLGCVVNAKDPSASVGDLYKTAWHMVHATQAKQQPMLPQGDDDDDEGAEDEVVANRIINDDDDDDDDGTDPAFRFNPAGGRGGRGGGRGAGAGGRGRGAWRGAEAAPLMQME